MERGGSHTNVLLTLYKIQYFAIATKVKQSRDRSAEFKEIRGKIVNTISGCEKMNLGLANTAVSRGAEFPRKFDLIRNLAPA